MYPNKDPNDRVVTPLDVRHEVATAIVKTLKQMVPLLSFKYWMEEAAINRVISWAAINAGIYLEAEQFELTIEDRMRLEDEVCTVIYDATEQ